MDFFRGCNRASARIGTAQMRRSKRILPDRAELKTGEIHVWNAPLAGDCATGELDKLLQPEERARASAFAFDLDRIRYIHSHAVVRQILSRYIDCDPSALVFQGPPDQKPRLAPKLGDPDLHFSLSHSNRCCLVAVREGSPVGVDVEQLRNVPDAASIAHRWFSRAESDALALLSGAQLQGAFYALWTHREAIIKALGANLEIGLTQLECALGPDGRVRVVSWQDDQAITRHWRVHPLEPMGGYLGALATLTHFDSLKCLIWDGDASADATTSG
jgi:4'-phosphopantetheinyl transferase